ncbi:MAG TPA: hypothetical protein VGF94_19060 [Kofleriaceae bacterium]|jgi:hypothetical protein
MRSVVTVICMMAAASSASAGPKETAQEAFHVYAATKLGVAASASHAMPEDTIGSDAFDPKVTIGAAWPFMAARIDGRGAMVGKLLRGWATADGQAITLADNFGVLLEQAGVWSGKSRDQLEKLPDAVAWSLNDTSSIGFYKASTSPIVKLGRDGAGTVTITLTYQEGGHGGGLSPEMKAIVVATVTKDHGATVVVGQPKP